MSQVHKIKCWPEHFQSVKAGLKLAEVRKDDRGYQVGDILHLQEWEPVTENYTKDEIFREVTHVLQGGQFGVEDGYVVMSLKHPNGIHIPGR